MQWGLMAHICATEICHHLSRQCLVTSSVLCQCGVIAVWSLVANLPAVFMEILSESTFKNVACKQVGQSVQDSTYIYWLRWGLCLHHGAPPPPPPPPPPPWRHDLRTYVQKQVHVSRACTSNHTSEFMWDVITCPCPRYLLLAQQTSYIGVLLIVPGCR